MAIGHTAERQSVFSFVALSRTTAALLVQAATANTIVDARVDYDALT